jgi:site-specific DNA-methyltransferase (adenine-specific)
VFNVPKPSANREHPTMKPIELIVQCLNNSAPRGGLVLDPFGGSGSTLMACEYTGRKGRLIELDPRYVDVICRRWQEHTAAKPVLESTGAPHDFTGGSDAESS